MTQLPYIRFRVWRRVWWTLWLVGRYQEIEMHPPPDATFADVMVWAEKIRRSGADCEVVYP